VLSAVIGERRRAMEDLERLLQQLNEQAITDPLTGLLNRRYLYEFLPRAVMAAKRNGVPLGVVMIDLDHFKRVNDVFGHAAGDFVLWEVGALLKASIRGSDVACRYGGEEFVLVLPDAAREGARHKAEQIRTEVERLRLEHLGRPLGTVTASLGVALFPDHAEGADSLIRASDEALYESKRLGRNRVTLATGERLEEPSPRSTVPQNETGESYPRQREGR
jgi:diguanylate cyclase (GGDEF)-like protein